MLTLKLTLSTPAGLSLSKEIEWDPLGRTDIQVLEDAVDELTSNMLSAQNAIGAYGHRSLVTRIRNFNDWGTA